MRYWRPTKLNDSTLVKDISYTNITNAVVIDNLAMQHVVYSGTLEFVFRCVRYRYYDVPVEIFLKMLNSKSLGKFYNSKIKGKYRCRRYRLKELL
jgi:hypothetical protein